MLGGTLIGMLMESFLPINSEVEVLVVQNFLFCGFTMIGYIGMISEWSYGAVLSISLFLGLLYAWNASVSRGLMSKIAPSDKKVIGSTSSSFIFSPLLFRIPFSLFLDYDDSVTHFLVSLIRE